MDRYRIVHKTVRKELDDTGDGSDFIAYKITEYLWRGESFPTRIERAAAFLKSIEIIKRGAPFGIKSYDLEFIGPILEDRYLKKKVNAWGEKIHVPAWRETSDNLELPLPEGNPSDS
jgi:hypothetical protein